MAVEKYLRLSADPLGCGEQDENGVDLSLIRGNLELTPEERLLRRDHCRRRALELRRWLMCRIWWSMVDSSCLAAARRAGRPA